MSSLIIAKLVLSFIISGVWISAATLIAEKMGTKIGGLFTNLPSNILISLVFIAIINGTDYVVASVPGIMVGLIIDTIFLFIYVLLLRFGLLKATTVSLLSWFLMAAASSKIDNIGLVAGVVVLVLLTLGLFFILEKWVTIASQSSSKKRYSIIQIVVRAIFAGTMVTSVILLSQFVSPFWVGVLSCFPAVLLSSMIILSINQSKEFAQATGKILLLSSSNIIVYALAVYFTYPLLGITLGTVLSFVLAFLWVLLFKPIIDKFK